MENKERVPRKAREPNYMVTLYKGNPSDPDEVELAPREAEEGIQNLAVVIRDRQVAGQDKRWSSRLPATSGRQHSVSQFINTREQRLIKQLENRRIPKGWVVYLLDLSRSETDVEHHSLAAFRVPVQRIAPGSLALVRNLVAEARQPTSDAYVRVLLEFYDDLAVVGQ